MLDLAIVIPVYNEQDCIENVFRAWYFEIKRLISGPFEFILINDGSTDKTGDLLDQLQQEFSELKVIHQSNQGHGPSIVNGYKIAIEDQAKWIFQVDSDNEFCPNDFERFWQNRITRPFLIGVRKQRASPWARQFLSHLLKILLKPLFNISPQDINTPYRLISNQLLKKSLDYISPLSLIPNILLTILAFSIGQYKEIEITHKKRLTGKAHLRYFRLLQFCLLAFLEILYFKVNFKNKVQGFHQIKWQEIHE